MNLPLRLDRPPYEGEWRTGGPLSRGTLLFFFFFFANTRWTRFSFVFSDAVIAARIGLAPDKGSFGCVRRRTRERKTNRSSSYLRGHPQTPVGDVPTELPTKLEVERKEKSTQHSTVGYRALKNNLILLDVLEPFP